MGKASLTPHVLPFTKVGHLLYPAPMLITIKSALTAIFYQPLFNLLFGLVAVLPGHSLGWAIVVLTLLIRLLLLAPSAAAVRSQRELQALQPKIDEVRATYKDQPEELNQKLLGLYQEHKVNPFGSCLPLLIQLPVLLVLYRVFLSGIHAQNFQLLYSFVPNPGSIHALLLGIDLVRPSLILAVVAGALQFLQTRQLMAKQQQLKDERNLPADEKPKEEDATKAAQDLSQRMVYFMPLLTVFIGATLPAALAVYWIVTTLFSIAQQWYLVRTQPALPHHHVAVKVTRR